MKVFCSKTDLHYRMKIRSKPGPPGPGPKQVNIYSLEYTSHSQIELNPILKKDRPNL